MGATRKALERFSKLGWATKAGICVFILVAGVLLYARWDAHRGLDTLVVYSLEPQAARNAKELIVFVHGYVKGNRAMHGVMREARKLRPQADIMYFEYPGQVFSNANPFRIAAQMEEQIRAVHEERRYESIHLVGYSAGALLLRKAYVYGWGSVEDLPFADNSRLTSRDPQAWVTKVDRFVLLAGMNRGWSHEEPPRELGAWKSMRNALGMWIGKLSGSGTLIRDLRRGEPFVANLRLQWLDTMERAKNLGSGSKPPTVIQLLGDRDDVVSKEDNRDVTVAKDFIWVGVNNTNHANVTDLDQPGAGADRRRKILQALGGEADIERLRRSMPAPQTDEDPEITTVVFVLHGIRDMGEWTSNFEEPLQRRFRELNPGPSKKLYVHRAGYGYFPMGPFLLGADRQANVRWFMDQVTELKARFPKLEDIHFIGHSNGTYVLASSLQKYSTLKVGRVVFAGSVVPRDYNWSGLAGRIDSVRNYVGLDDLVVGIFPNLFEVSFFRWINPDLGSAGFNGFRDGRFKSLETQFVKGGHAAALHSDNVQGIIDFILEGKKVDPEGLYVRERPASIAYVSQLCWIIWLALLMLVVGGGWLLIRYARRWHQRRAPKWFSSTATISVVSLGYVAVLALLLNTV